MSENDIENQDKDYVAVIKVLMPSNVKVTEYQIPVRAADQVEAMARAIGEWNDKTNPDNFKSIDIQKPVKS